MGFQSWLEAAPPGGPTTCDPVLLGDHRAATRSLPPSRSTGCASPRSSPGSPTCAARSTSATARWGSCCSRSRSARWSGCPPAASSSSGTAAAPSCGSVPGWCCSGSRWRGLRHRRDRGRRRRGAALLRLRHGHLGRRDERRGGRRRAHARPQHHAALPRGLELRHLRRRRGSARWPPRSAYRWPPTTSWSARWPSARPSSRRAGSPRRAGRRARPRRPRPTRSAWLEPRTLAIGLMVLAFTLAEGAANDWLALVARRRLRRAPLGGRRRLRHVRRRDDHRPPRRPGRCSTASAVPPHAGVGLRGLRRRPDPRLLRDRRRSPWSASCCGASAPRWASRSG